MPHTAPALAVGFRSIATSDTLFARCDTKSIGLNLCIFGYFWNTWNEISRAKEELRKLLAKSIHEKMSEEH